MTTLVPSYLPSSLAVLPFADAAIKTTEILKCTLTRSSYLHSANRDLGKKSGKGISIWQIKSTSSVIFT